MYWFHVQNEKYVSSLIRFVIRGYITQTDVVADIQSRVGQGGYQAVTLKDLIKLAVEGNPDLKAARLKWGRETQRFPQAVAFDDPTFSYVLPLKKVETRLGPQNHIVSLSQKLPFWGKRELKGEVAKESVRIAKTEYDKRARDLVISVKKSYYELFYLQKALFLAEGNLKVLEHFSTVGPADYEKDLEGMDLR